MNQKAKFTPLDPFQLGESLLGLVVAVGAAMALGVSYNHTSEAPTATSRSAMNREIERRLDLVVNGTSTVCVAPRNSADRISASDVPRSTPHPQPCSSSEPWREKP